MGVKRDIPPVRWGRLVLAIVLQVAFLTVLASSIWLALDRRFDLGVMIGPWLIGSMSPTVLQFRQRRRTLEAAPVTMSLADRTAAWTASYDGPVPLDPDIRAEALRLARHRYGESENELGRAYLVVMLVLAAAGLVVGVLLSPWWLLTAGCFGLLGALYALAQRRLRQRYELLRDTVTDLAS